MFDLVREQTKAKLKGQIGYKAEKERAILDKQLKQINPDEILHHVEEYKEYPLAKRDVKEGVTTFGTSHRNYGKVVFQCEQSAFELSPLDFDHLLKSQKAPNFNSYMKRKDNFLTKEQALELQQQKEEALLRIQRL